MTRNAFAGAILLVEGDRDSRFWRARVDNNGCRIVLCGGKPQLIGGMLLVNARGIPGVLAVLDPDLAGIVGPQTVIPNVLAPDAHDLESMLFHSSAFNSVMAEYADPLLIAQQEQQSGRTIKELVIDRALPFARLRWWLAVTVSPCAFDRFKPGRFIDTRWIFREPEWLLEVSNATGFSVQQIEAGLSASPAHSARDFCHGKDLIAITAAGLRQALGHTAPGDERVSAHFRASLAQADLQASALGIAITAWEHANSPYKILRP